MDGTRDVRGERRSRSPRAPPIELASPSLPSPDSGRAAPDPFAMSKIDPIPHRPPAFDPNEERYWDARDLEVEMRRVFEVCHNCRMCVGYCGTFPDVFGQIDHDIEKRGATGSELLDDRAFTRATELCWQCKLCFVKCPYTPDEGHAWQIDVPRLLMREKAVRVRRNGATLQDT